MSGRPPAHRRPAIPHSDAPRGNCRWCGEAILHESGPRRGQPNRRRRWHPVCVQVYNQSDPREARRRVRRRDGGRCAACGLDTNALRRRVRGRGRARRLRELGFRVRGSLWELDHVVPLVDGGGHELANLQTLCTPCHARKTASEARARSAARREGAEDALLARVDALLERSARLARSLDLDLDRDGTGPHTRAAPEGTPPEATFPAAEAAAAGGCLVQDARTRAR